MTVRLEEDAFGAVEIPEGRLWGAQTQRALAVFGASGPRLPVAVIRAFAAQKAAAARANLALGVLDAERAGLILSACARLGQGAFDDHFPLPVWQTGSGTQTNMNVNEVLANAANMAAGQGPGTRAPVHPNDHVNRSQSSNDSFPTVMQIAAVAEARGRLAPELDRMAVALEERAAAFAGIPRLGRTHLNDAVPVPLSQGFAASAAEMRRSARRLSAALDELLALPQGGTAAGSGLNAPEGFDRAFCAALSEATGEAFRPAAVKVEGMAGHDALLGLSAVCEALAVALTRLCNDVRHLAAGPHAGPGELSLPDDGLTSSIMPGKRNATLAEALVQVCQHVAGCHETVSRAAASGVWDLNVSKPVLIHALLGAMEALAQGMEGFRLHCLAGIEPRRARLADNLARSMMAATALTPRLGHDRVAGLIRRAEAQGLTLRAACLAEGILGPEAFDRLVDPERMARGGLPDPDPSAAGESDEDPEHP
ncbi:Fumarate hydratase class II [Rhodobacter sp. AKP1]|nr:Fumarate hydratase class II [Rhodobacter sp. AKP1]